MQYASYVPEPIVIEPEFQRQKIDYVNEVIKKYNLIKLKSDYLGTISYYLHKDTGTVYEFDNSVRNVQDLQFKVSQPDITKHLLELNDQHNNQQWHNQLLEKDICRSCFQTIDNHNAYHPFVSSKFAGQNNW
jgi:hypothetical protein